MRATLDLNMSTPQNYMINVACPHCQRKAVVAISGFGGELAVRVKHCRGCDQPYSVQLLATTSAETDLTDGSITELRSRIAWLRKERQQTYAELLVKAEQAQRLYREALTEARAMRDRHDSN